ncbi:galactoside alpha-(1,2)-fucosyltransferase 2-like [Ornithodoros turicata]|uniref:galactoside alpha-(1,2)-fucosyltransferase 2-like n=1 Tax=Ornithodoros turicata TaxID=34597 RepID=UPI003139E23E
MTVRTNDRLESQMGAYAVLYGLAKLNGYEPYIRKDMYRILSPLFRLTLPIMDQTIENITWTDFSVNEWMSDSYLNIAPQFVQLRVYFCSWTFFHQYRSEILRDFSFHDHVKRRSWSTLAKLKGSRKDPTYIGVHVRRGDYVTANIDHGLRADKPYLDKAMTYFRVKYHEPVFVVASDGVAWCRENIDATRGDVYFAEEFNESSPGYDLALLAHCNHTIMTTGIFGFWAAYLAGGETIYFHSVVAPDSKWWKIFEPEAHYLPEWIDMQANLSSLQLISPAKNKNQDADGADKRVISQGS